MNSASTSQLSEPFSKPSIGSTLKSIFSSIPLIRVLVRRDLRLRYHSSVLGYLWTLIEPLLLAGAYYFVFIILRGTAEPMYPLLVLTGVLIWSMFTKTVRFAVNSLRKNAGLLQQIHFPHATLIVSKCGANYIITLLSMLVLIPFMIFVRSLRYMAARLCVVRIVHVRCLSSSNRIFVGSSERSLQRHRPSRRLCDEGWFLSHTNYVHHRLHPEGIPEMVSTW